MIYLSVSDVLAAGVIAAGKPVIVRDAGLLASAIERPKITIFGVDAYPDTWLKAAALMQSLACNHVFVDGNKRTALVCAWSFLVMNDQATDELRDVESGLTLVLDVATGRLDGIEDIASALRTWLL